MIWVYLINIVLKNPKGISSLILTIIYNLLHIIQHFPNRTEQTQKERAQHKTQKHRGARGLGWKQTNTQTNTRAQHSTAQTQTEVAKHKTQKGPSQGPNTDRRGPTQNTRHRRAQVQSQQETNTPKNKGTPTTARTPQGDRQESYGDWGVERWRPRRRSRADN